MSAQNIAREVELADQLRDANEAARTGVAGFVDVQIDVELPLACQREQVGHRDIKLGRQRHVRQAAKTRDAAELAAIACNEIGQFAAFVREVHVDRNVGRGLEFDTARPRIAQPGKHGPGNGALRSL